MVGSPCGPKNHLRPEICLVDIESSLGPARTALARCGLQTWSFDSRCMRTQLDQHEGTLCVVVDLPDTQGLRLLIHLRQLAISLPAILVAGADEGLPKDHLTEACVVAVLHRPANVRELLRWIASIAASLSEHREAVRTSLSSSPNEVLSAAE